MEGVRRVLGGCMGGSWMGVHAAEAVVHNNVLLALLYEGMSLYMPEQGGLLGGCSLVFLPLLLLQLLLPLLFL